MDAAEAALKDLTLTKTPQQVADGLSEWVGALAGYIRSMRRARNYIKDPDRDFGRSAAVVRDLQSLSSMFISLERWDGWNLLHELDVMLGKLSPADPSHQRLAALKVELYRKLSEAKVVVAEIAIGA